MIITPSAYALTLAQQYADNLPVLLWDNRITVATIAASEAAAAYPASNLANPSTVLKWQGVDTDDHLLTAILDGSEQTGAAGVARHNWGSGAVTVSLEGLPAGDDPDEPTDWVEIIAEHVPANDRPLLYRFEPDYFDRLRIRLQPTATIPEAAVLYVGTLLTMERGVQPHTPLPLARRRNVVTGRSESGNFLGRIVTTASLASSATFKVLTPAWYRANLDPFADASARLPFFFAWSPATYPAEVGYAWLTSDLVPSVSHLAGYLDVTLEMEGLAL